MASGCDYKDPFIDEAGGAFFASWEGRIQEGVKDGFFGGVLNGACGID